MHPNTIPKPENFKLNVHVQTSQITQSMASMFEKSLQFMIDKKKWMIDNS